ncbi:expressed unknown protein [Seminavis robusta]|uniref:Peptidase M11 gametolysin domain-containing protein n=1 Tax=Seminavis robusta TaxID=568900 RepID=A0A9N8DA29_9STRA|nr:expressed unknown protein [Seminavis robusta]|eukprot:Sro30_g019780.1 n/a (554) ;mRNA; r:124523-126448
MKPRNLLLAALVVVTAILVVAFVVNFEQLLVRKNASHEINENDGLICHVELTLMSLDNGGDEEDYECVVVSTNKDSALIPDMSVAIDLPLAFIYNNRKALDDGDLYIQIPGGSVNQEFVEGFGLVSTNVSIPPSSEILVLNATEVSSMRHHRKRRRRTSELKRELADGMGVRTVMVFRITTDNASPEIGATEIEERMYSTTQFSFASQFEKCSFGELTFQPFDLQTPVTELYVPGDVESFTERTILNAATRQAAALFGSDVWDTVDHAIFCMPDGTTGKPYIAYSGVGSFFSVYHNVRCAYPTTVMHEIAHNCGLGHAFENGEEYGDETSIMGFSSSSKTGPSKCFNGQNIWHFGWFKSRSIMVDPFQGHHVVELAPFVDYDKIESYQAVLITVFDMHFVYNRAKGFNFETSEYQNKVTIAKEQNEINSELMAMIDMEHPIFTIENVFGTGKSLYVELCELVAGDAGEDYYVVSIGLDYSMCPTPKPPKLTPSPTAISNSIPISNPWANALPNPMAHPLAHPLANVPTNPWAYLPDSTEPRLKSPLRPSELRR